MDKSSNHECHVDQDQITLIIIKNWINILSSVDEGLEREWKKTCNVWISNIANYGNYGR